MSFRSIQIRRWATASLKRPVLRKIIHTAGTRTGALELLLLSRATGLDHNAAKGTATLINLAPVDYMAISALYICYFGVNEPLVQTQVLPYLRELASAGINLHLLTFEPRLRETWDQVQLKHQEKQLRQQGIFWAYLPYHKRPSLLATLYDIVAGARFIVCLARREGIRVLHARAHMPLAMALLAQRFVRAKLLFDIRGLMAEEYADAGIWSYNSMRFRLVKFLERAGIRRADQIVVLTNRLRDWLVAHNLKPGGQIEVIPCCVELARFDQTVAQSAEAHSPENRFDVLYAGSLVGL
jgi:glycosyltransferase involved in cell wall biosynthesis